MGLPSPGYCCTLFQRDKKNGFILPAGLGIPTLKLQLDWKLLQVSSVGGEGSLALLVPSQHSLRDVCSPWSPKSSSSQCAVGVNSTCNSLRSSQAAGLEFPGAEVLERLNPIPSNPQYIPKPHHLWEEQCWLLKSSRGTRKHSLAFPAPASHNF